VKPHAMIAVSKVQCITILHLLY